MSQVLTVGEALGLLSPMSRGPIMGQAHLDFRVAGAEMNVAIGLSRLGISVEYWGAVGQDPPGRAIRAALRSEGVGVEHLHLLPYPTGLFMKEWYGLSPEPQVYYYRSDSAMRRWGLPEDFMEQAAGIDWLHFSGISWMLNESIAEDLTRLSQHFQQQGKRVSLDLNVRRKLASIEAWSLSMRRVLPLASLVIGSETELELLFGTADPDRLWHEQVMRDDQVWVIKEGTTRTRAFQKGEPIAVAKTVPVSQVVDVVGAGDGFAAGVIAGRLRDLDWGQTLGLANVVGAYAVSHTGDWEGYPTWEMVEAYRHNAVIDR